MIEIVVGTFVVFLALGFALAESDVRGRRWGEVLSSMLVCGVIWGSALFFASISIDVHWFLATLILITAVLLTGVSIEKASRPLRTDLGALSARASRPRQRRACFSTLATCALSVWIIGAGVQSDIPARASAAVSVASFLLATFSLGPLSEELQKLFRLEGRRRKQRQRPTSAEAIKKSHSERSDFVERETFDALNDQLDSTRLQMAGTAIASAAAFVVLLMAVAHALDAASFSAGAPASLLLVVGFAIATLVAVLGIARIPSYEKSRSKEPPQEDPSLDLDIGTRIVACAAVAIWLFGAGLALLVTPLHVWAIGLGAGVVTGILIYESLVFNSAGFILVAAGRWRIGLALGCGLSIGAWVWWLVSAGLWNEGLPVAPGWVIAITALVLIPSLLLALAIGKALWRHTTARRKAMHEFAANHGADQSLYVVVVFFAVVLPTTVVARLNELETPARGVTGLADVLSVVGLGLGFVAFFRTAHRHARRERCLPPPAALESLVFAEQGRAARERVKKLKHHVYWQIGLTSALFSLGGLWVAQRVIGCPL